MIHEDDIAQHYTHGNLLASIRAGLVKMGKSIQDVTIQDLAPVAEFHIGSRGATEHLLAQLPFTADHHVLDVGCGIGGTSRYIADKFDNQVTGIDLTREFVEVGNTLSGWVGLSDRVSLVQGSALQLPFDAGHFDGAVMLHVGMNIHDKDALFAGVHRALRPGAHFGVFDIMRLGQGSLNYPVPWSTDADDSLASPDAYVQALRNAGFSITAQQRRGDFALEFFKQVKAKAKANGGPSSLGLHTLMQATTPVKIKNMIEGIASGNVAPVEIIAHKPA